MRVLKAIPELGALPGPAHLAIGVFDGLHLGHQTVIDAARRRAKADGGSVCVVTFDPHPVSVLRAGDAPRLLTSTRHKIWLLDKFGIENLLLVTFTPEFSRQAPEEFVRDLVSACRPLGSVCVGNEWAFGRGRSGNVELLRALGRNAGFTVAGVDAVTARGRVISSTVIRKAVRAGRLDEAADLLGRPYTVLGTVVEGDKLGRTIGFPTANLRVHNEQLPPGGVYAVTADLDGSSLHGVANLGHRPTVSADNVARTLEIHLLDFNNDIYGRDIEVTFLRFLRPEKKFSGLEDLKAQIQLDIAAARTP